MPSKYIRKIFKQKSCYHIYNRGTNRQRIFLGPTDQKVFKSLAQKLSQASKSEYVIKIDTGSLIQNHYHFLLYQEGERDISMFMRSLIQCYTAYFNQRYTRSGSLFTGPYRARLLESPEEIIQVREYILFNLAATGETKASPFTWRNTVPEIEVILSSQR